MRAGKPRGLVLISVFFIVVLIAMYVASSLILTKGQYGALRQTAEDRRAEEAARSGLEYAQARLEENADWKGDGNGIIVDTPSLLVREDRGNVVGVLLTSDGGRAQFRIRFNHQDGGAGTDAMPNPSNEMWIDSPHVSVNNILHSYKTSLPLGDGNNNACEGTVAGYPVPAFTAAIVCEGRVYERLANASSFNPNPPASTLQATRVIETFYRISDFSGDAPAQDAVTMAGRDVLFELFPNAEASQRVSLSNFQGTGPSQLRSRGDISVTDLARNAERVESVQGNLLLPSDKTLLAELSEGVTRGDEDVNGDFYKLTWDDAGHVSQNAAKVPAGVYVFWNTDQKLHYYEKDYESYLKDIKKNPSDPGTVVNDLPAGMTFVKAGNAGPDGATSNKHRFVITGDLKVEKSGSVTDFTIMPRAGASEDLEPQNPSTGMGWAVSQFHLNEDMSDAEILGAIGAGGGFSDPATIHRALLGVAGSGQLTLDLSPYGQSSRTVVSWDGSGANLGGVGGQALLQAMAEGKKIELTGVTEPNGKILKKLGNSGKYRLKDHALERLIFDSKGGDLAEIDLEAASNGTILNNSEPLGARDFEVTLAPQSEDGVRMTAPGDIRIAANIKGSGASISAEGDIRLVGLGFDLDAANGGEGTDVSFYSKGDIVISTLRRMENEEYEYSGLDLRGVLYSWKDIELKMSSPDEGTSSDPQKVWIQGTMVAYGGEPGKDQPGANGHGNISIAADQIDLVFDPGYLLGVQGAEGYKISLAPLSQSYRD